MSYSVELCEVPASYLAVIQARVTPQSLVATIRQILDGNEVYQFIKEANLQKAGYNVMVYRNDQQTVNEKGFREFVMEVGVQVAAPFEGNGRVICSATPAGHAATTLHTGPYDQLGQAHSAIMEWARAQNHSWTGLNWEIYGDWQADPTKLTTEVFYLLK